MNPRSGGGKVGKFDLKRKAQALGAEVALLEGPEQVDVVSLAREAVARGADLLGVAGGDGTQALVAEVAAEHGIPFLVLSAGTRNHFALDLGLDREDPAAGLNALTDGVELVVDLGLIGDRTFVNNASFGAYAEVVQSPAYRRRQAGTTLQALPDLLTGQRGAHLVARCGDFEIDSPQAVLVSNNPYGKAARRVSRDCRARTWPVRLVRELRLALPHRREIPDRESLLLQTPESLARSLALDVRTGQDVIRIDRDAKEVEVHDLRSGANVPGVVRQARAVPWGRADAATDPRRRRPACRRPAQHPGHGPHHRPARTRAPRAPSSSAAATSVWSSPRPSGRGG